MSKIKVDTDNFINCINSINTMVEECESIHKNIEVVTQELLDTWYGDSKNEFDREYKILKQNMSNYIDILKSMLEGLNDIQLEYNRVDVEIAKSLNIK